MNEWVVVLEQDNAHLWQQLQNTADVKPVVVEQLVTNHKRLPAGTKLPEFSGHHNEDIQMWMDQLNLIYKSAGLTVEDKFLYTMPLLRDVAASWFVTLAKETPTMTWDHFVTKIVERFTRQCANLVIRDELYSLSQQGSAVLYSEKFQILASRVSDMSEIEKISLYQHGLYSSL
ncbi:hypothetical protein FBU31_002518, partial [Coemansia sp. 'formosensis']